MFKYIIITLILSTSLIASDHKTFNIPKDGILPYFEKGDLNPIWDIKSPNQNKFLHIKDFKLISNQKQSFSSKDLKGKVSAVSFFFATCQGYCPRMTNNIKHAFKQYKNHETVNFVSLSVTPNIDQMDVLESYAKKYNINEKNWHLVRGKRDVIYNIARKQLQADLDVDLKKSSDQFVHSESVYLLDKDLFIRGIYNGNKKASMLQMAKDMKLIINASEIK